MISLTSIFVVSSVLPYRRSQTMLLECSFSCASVVQDLKISFRAFSAHEEALPDVVVCK